MPSDPKPDGPVRDPSARKRFHRAGVVSGECAVCGVSRGLTIHHVFDRSDLEQNFVFLCGSGTTGCHGEITNEDQLARLALGQFIIRRRRDIVDYVVGRVGEERAHDWFTRRLFVDMRRKR